MGAKMTEWSHKRQTELPGTVKALAIIQSLPAKSPAAIGIHRQILKARWPQAGKPGKSAKEQASRETSNKNGNKFRVAKDSPQGNPSPECSI
ncbi:MAG: hypothetical protein ACXWQO_01690 [Bdellovibrionota bacterium]